MLQSQQAIAEANRVIAAVSGSGSTDIDAAFDRWEISIAKSNTGNHYFSSTKTTALRSNFDSLSVNAAIF